MDRGRSRSRSSSSGRAVRARSRSRAMSVTPVVRMRRYASIPLKGVHSFERTVPITFTLNQQTGFRDFNGINQGKYLAFAFTLQQILVQGTVLGAPSTTPYNVPNATDFSNLFDSYRIDGVKFRLMSASNVSQTSQPTQVMPTMWIFNDNNDSIVPTTTQQFTEREGLRVISFTDTNIKTHRVAPKVAQFTFQGITPAYAQGIGKAWVDMLYPAVQYFGTKIYYDTMGDVSNTTIGQFEFMVTLQLSFKGVR